MAWDPEPFAAAIRAAIDALGLSRQAAADYLQARGFGKSASAVTKWAAGDPERDPGLSVARELDHLFGAEGAILRGYDLSHGADPAEPTTLAAPARDRLAGMLRRITEFQVQLDVLRVEVLQATRESR